MVIFRDPSISNSENKETTGQKLGIKNEYSKWLKLQGRKRTRVASLPAHLTNHLSKKYHHQQKWVYSKWLARWHPNGYNWIFRCWNLENRTWVCLYREGTCKLYSWKLSTSSGSLSLWLHPQAHLDLGNCKNWKSTTYSW